MKIAYATDYDAQDIANWSGLGSFIAKSLVNQDFDIDYISTSETNLPISLRASLKIKYLFYKNLLQKDYKKDRNLLLLKNYARQIAASLDTSNAEIVFSPGSFPISFLDSKLPIVSWNDATFAGLVGFYPMFSNLCEETIRDGNTAEQAALDRCRLAIYSSDWAAQTAIANYRVNPEKVKVVPFGANVDDDCTLEEVKDLIDSRPANRCKLLFLGVDWQRKGGDIAFKVAEELNRSGLPTELIVAGCQPIITQPLPDFVKPIGFVSKSTKDGRLKIRQLIAESHFLILPSLADCSPIVLCEANSLGVPCISTNIGGIPTIIKNEINGYLFSTDADTSELCKYISNLFLNYDDYKSLALSSFNEYESRLNWSVAGQTVRKIIFECL